MASRMLRFIDRLPTTNSVFSIPNLQQQNSVRGKKPIWNDSSIYNAVQSPPDLYVSGRTLVSSELSDLR